MKYIFNALLWVILIADPVLAQVPAARIPDFSFYKLDRTAFTNKNLEPGKLLFFVFFDAGCEHCQHAMQYLNQHHAEFKKTAIYLITLDSLKAITRFMATYGNNLKSKKNVTILQDPNYEFMLKFKPRKYPSIFLYSAKKELIMYDDNEQNLFKFSQEINKAVKLASLFLNCYLEK